MTFAATHRLRLVMATAVGILACGLVLWPIPYEEVALLQGRPSLALWLLSGAGSGLVAAFLLRGQFVLPMLTVPAGFAIAVFGRVVVEGSAAPTSHNLWPFEVGIAMGVGITAGVVGAGLALGLQRVYAYSVSPTASRNNPH